MFISLILLSHFFVLFLSRCGVVLDEPFDIVDVRDDKFSLGDTELEPEFLFWFEANHRFVIERSSFCWHTVSFFLVALREPEGKVLILQSGDRAASRC